LALPVVDSVRTPESSAAAPVFGGHDDVLEIGALGHDACPLDVPHLGVLGEELDRSGLLTVVINRAEVRAGARGADEDVPHHDTAGLDDPLRSHGDLGFAAVIDGLAGRRRGGRRDRRRSGGLARRSRSS
jgi:hypothetical protein